MENNGIYNFSSDDIKLARDNWAKAYKSIAKDEIEKFNKTFGAVVELCYTISRPVGFIQGMGLDKYKEIMETHNQMGNIILKDEEAKISLDGKKAIDEMTKPLFRAEQYKNNNGDLHDDRI